MILSSTGNNPGEQAALAVGSTNKRLSLTTPEGATATFQVLWGGAGGTAGLGADFGAGQPLDLTTSALSFSLRSSDQANNFTWTFTDSLGQVASYSGNFPINNLPSPLIPYSISLNDFSNSASVNWNSIDFISFYGGDVASLDMSIPAPLEVVASTVPEPGTWALFASGLTLLAVLARRKASQRS